MGVPVTSERRSFVRVDRGAALTQFGSLVFEQTFENGAMAMRFVLAIATDREVRLMGEAGKQFDIVRGAWSRHLSAIFSDESGPLGRGAGAKGQLHGWNAGRQVGEPNVIPIA